MQSSVSQFKLISWVSSLFVLSVACSALLLPTPVKAQALNELFQAIPTLASNRSVSEAQVTPDGKYIVYVADANVRRVRELFSVPVGGGEVVQLSPPLSGDQDVERSFEITPDSQHVVYRSDQNTNNVIELFRVPVTGGDSVALNPQLPADRDVSSRFRISPDGSRVIYLADLNSNDVIELFSVPFAGGPSERLNPDLVANGNVSSSSSLSFNPDGSTVIYAADQFIDNVFELFIVPATGGEVTRLSPPLMGEQDAGRQQFSSDGKRVVFTMNLKPGSRFDRRDELFSVDINGDNFVTLIPSFPDAFGRVSSFQISSDNRNVVYEADQLTDNVTELFSVPIDGATEPIRLNPVLPERGDIDEFQITPDGDQVVFSADQTIDNIDELFSVPINGGTAIRYDGLLGEEDTVIDFVISADNRHIIVERRSLLDNILRLARVPLEGGAPIMLGPPFGDPDEEEEGELELSKNGEFISYVPPDERRIFAARISLLVDDNELCFPISAKNSKVAVICL